MWPAGNANCTKTSPRGLCSRKTPTVKPKTAAQRQADRKARELAAGRVQWKRWVHPEDVPALAEFADKLARKRAKQTERP